MNIPFVDLSCQYFDCKQAIDMAISHTIDSSSFITGSDVNRFEKTIAAYVGAESCAATGSGTMALICALKSLGIGPGDEVLTTPHTFVATTESIVLVGAVPIFVDIDPDTHLLDIDVLDRYKTDRTKAVLFVDIYGQCPHLTKLRQWCNNNNLFMIEDAAHSFGTCWSDLRVGSISDLTCFSFNPIKTLGAMGDAGCVTGNKNLIDMVKIFRDHGRTSRYDVVHIGYNAKIDNLQANILLAKLENFEKWRMRKKQIYKYYTDKLSNVIKCVFVDPQVDMSPYVFVIQTCNRDPLQKYLHASGIETSIHYCTTVNCQPAYKAWYTFCPTAESTVKEILSIPCRFGMSDLEVEYVVDKIIEFDR